MVMDFVVSLLFSGRMTRVALTGDDGINVLIAPSGYAPLIREYIYFLLAKLAFHRQHPEFNGKFLALNFTPAKPDQAPLNTKSTSVSSRSMTQTKGKILLVELS